MTTPKPLAENFSSKNQKVDRFIQALATLEKAGTVQAICDLFDDSCEVKNFLFPEPLKGRQGAETFWTEYRDSFQTIESRFTHRSETENTVVLEWISEGTLKTGHPVSYSGVSILEFDGDRIRSFRAYYDSAALQRTAKAA
ncbi:MAG: nuclear transport factor 2 family protein [Methylotenera sp.]|nr:nuclear transport factor 2 family protein [Oligoflexia bacterium]